MKTKLTFEQAMTRLDEIINVLSTGKTTLEESLKLYAESAELFSFCNQSLEAADLQVEELFSSTASELETES